MNLPTSITVTKNNTQVFHAESGRLGMEESACRDFICFASPIIGAPYYYLCYEEAAKRIANDGFETCIVEGGRESRF